MTPDKVRVAMCDRPARVSIVCQRKQIYVFGYSRTPQQGGCHTPDHRRWHLGLLEPRCAGRNRSKQGASNSRLCHRESQ
jgi:hypothetical protein